MRGLNEVPGPYRNDENSMSLMFSRGLNSNSLIGGGGGGAGASNFFFDRSRAAPGQAGAPP